LDEDKGRGWITIPGLPGMEFRLNRELPDGQPQTIRITRTPRRIVASLVYTVLDPEPSADAPQNPVGIDAGVTNRLTLSDGTILPGRRQDRQRSKRLQRKLSRAGVSRDGKGARRVDVEWQKIGGKWMRPSGGRRKVATTLAKEQQRRAESDCNAKHRLTTDLVRQYDYFVVEDLQIRNMTRSAKGTADNPGANVRQKAGLNRSILEQGWGEIFAQIAYKAASAGKQCEQINPQYTSQTCSVCGVADGKSRRSQARFVCTGCGHADNADVNAAKNILSLGLKDLGGGGTLTSNGQSPGVRQETAHVADHNRGSGAPFGERQETRRHATKTDAQSDKSPLHWQQLFLPGFS
jgi:putative transposase